MHIDSTSHPKPRRVLSPHLQIYRLPLTAVLSISHRISGVLLAAGFILGNLFLVAGATNADTFESITRWLALPFGKFVLAGWLLLFNYHLVHGVRHLVWDLGVGFSRSKQTLLGTLEIVSALILTVAMIFTPSIIAMGSST